MFAVHCARDTWPAKLVSDLGPFCSLDIGAVVAEVGSSGVGPGTNITQSPLGQPLANDLSTSFASKYPPKKIPE